MGMVISDEHGYVLNGGKGTSCCHTPLGEEEGGGWDTPCALDSWAIPIKSAGSDDFPLMRMATFGLV